MGQKKTLLQMHMQLQLHRVAVLLLSMTVLQLFVCSDAGLKKGDVGTCMRDIIVTKSIYNSTSRSSKCPKDYNQCSDWRGKKEIKGFIPRKHRCCETKIKQTAKKPLCCQDWEYDKDKDVCKPQCHPTCIDGECIGPNQCKCKPHLVLNGTKCVTPVCEPACVNGMCRANNTCECNPELKPFNSTHCVKNCEAGFKNDPISLECVPHCNSPCLNGKCTAPNFCTCAEGFVQTDNYTCAPECTPSCQNGTCTGPNSCTCNEGYETDPQNSFKCLPKCEPHCGDNSTCIAPDMCQCFDGYETLEDKGNCKPVCKNCVHGECVAPNHCQCSPGYSEDGNICSPQCPDVNCTHGYCLEPNKCTCNEGYDFNVITRACEPICEPTCVNSTCERPGMCVCITGYEVTHNLSVCKPYCGPCDNGVCVAPYTCICNDGKNMTDGKCPTSLKSVDCETCRTDCTETYGCFCSDGRPCYYIEPESTAAANVSVAGFPLMWAMGGALALLLVVMLIVVMVKLYRRQAVEDKVPDQNGNPYGSIVYTVPDTLVHQSSREDQIEETEEMLDIDNRKETNGLLSTPEEALKDFVKDQAI